MVPTPILEEASNLVELAQWQAQHNPDRIALTFLPKGEDEERILTYAELDRRARALAVRLLRNGKPGDRALLLCPSSLDAIVGLYGCLYAGIIGVFTTLPRPDSTLTALQSIADYSGAKLALTTTSYLAGIRDSVNSSALKSLCWLATDETLLDAQLDDWRPPDVTRESLALLMFTSGSTAEPKGVMYSHGTIIREMSVTGRGVHLRPETVMVSWSPLYHIGGILMPLIMTATGMRFVFMPPQAFLERPIRWLNAMSKYRGSISSSFNFGLQICIERTTPEERARLNLSACESLVIGGERLRADLVERFFETFAPVGLLRSAIRPGYGLTETLGFVSIRDPGLNGFQSYALSLDKLERNRVVQVDPAAEKAQIHMGCGLSMPEKRAIIVDPITLKTCPANVPGEIWIFSEGIASGYWNRPAETQEIFQAYTADTNDGPYFRSGDIGCVIGDDLVITGRMKEMIILHGKNYFSQDLEKTVETAHPQLIPGSIAAFPLTVGDEERLAVACETKGEVEDAAAAEIIHAVRSAIANDQQQAVYLVALVRPGTLPRSATGKLLRFACRESLLSAQLDMIKLSRLADLETAPVETESGYIAPRTAIERALVGIWSSVLGKAHIGVNDNFFDQGGDSLLGVQLLAQVQDVFQIELPAQLLFKTTTIAGMAALITEYRQR